MYLLGGFIFIGAFLFAFKAGMGEMSNKTIYSSLTLLTISFFILSYVFMVD